MKHQQYQRFQKTYLSRAMTRAMAVEHPIGDPHGGAAFGERNDPVSAILSIATMAGAAGGAAALVGGTVTLGTVAAGLAFAGAAISLVGNVTGNQDMMKFGAVAGMVGGLGMGIDALGNWLSEVNAVTPEAAQAVANQPAAAAQPSVSDAIVGANPAEEALGSTQVQLANAPALPSNTDLLAAPPSTQGAMANGGVNPVTGEVLPQVTQASPEFGGMNSAIGPTGGETGFPINSDMSKGIINNAAEGGVGSSYSGSNPYTQISNPATAGQPGADWNYFTDGANNGVAISPKGEYFLNGQQITAQQGQAMGILDKTGNIASDSWRWMKENPELVKVGADAVGGAMKYLMPSASDKAQTNAYNATAEAREAEAERIRYQIQRDIEGRANMNRNLNNYRASGVNRNAVTVTPPIGLINSAKGP